MIKEINILLLEDKLKSDNYTPLRKYFLWEKVERVKGGIWII